ncbi:Hypothetical protein (Fragment) [Durusdinium trenchii]|uniref:Glutathione transferase n=1 Tax=Durusdinium trenchii TaxID=1381693 RepID=A0ABP0MYC7_9DINO
MPQLKFWHDAAGWCPHCMVSAAERSGFSFVSWVVLEELRVPYVMDVTPLRAYLKDGEKKKQRMVPVIQLIDEERSSASEWIFEDALKHVGRGEQVCAMLSERFPAELRRAGLTTAPPRAAQSTQWSLFGQLQAAHSAYKRLPGGRPTWGVAGAEPQHQEQLTAALDALETALAASARQTASPSYFLNGSKPNMIDLMLLPMLERVEALLLHPFLQPSRLHLSTWPRIWAMLAEGRRPGVCSFGELTSDAETLLAISLREDPGRTPYTEGTQMDPTSLSVQELQGRSWQRVLLKGRRDSVEAGGMRLMEGVLRQRPWEEPVKELPRPEEPWALGL